MPAQELRIANSIFNLIHRAGSGLLICVFEDMVVRGSRDVNLWTMISKMITMLLFHFSHADLDYYLHTTAFQEITHLSLVTFSNPIKISQSVV